MYGLITNIRKLETQVWQNLETYIVNKLTK